MTMYTIAGKPVSEEEFERAAHICMGKPLDQNLVSTVFEIFDKDGENSISLTVEVAIIQPLSLPVQVTIS